MTGPGSTDPPDTDTGRTGTARVPAGTDPASTDPASTDPTGTDPTDTETSRIESDTPQPAQLPPYLLGLRLAGRRVVVVGGGRVATRRVPALVAAGAEVELISTSVTPALDSLVAAGRIRWSRRRYADGDCAGAWLVHACTSDAAANAAVAADAERHHIWCVRADDGQASAAWTPASGQVGPITVAVHAGGDPRRAASLRDAVLERLREGTLAAGAGRGHEGKAGRVALVGGGPGDPELITVRGRRLLGEADVVVADRLAPLSLLDELPPHVQVVDASKIPGGRQMTQAAINELLVAEAKAGRFVVRLKGGDPFVYGRGLEEVLACLEAGVEVEVVPGVSSAVAVPASAWIPVTHRGVSQEFTVVSGHVGPDDPQSTVDWRRLAGSAGTLVLLMSVVTWPKIAAALVRHGRDPDQAAVCIQEGTTRSARMVCGTVGTLAAAMAEAGIRPPAVIVVGDVVRTGLEAADAARALATDYHRRNA
jgi:uroporphyrin-III C-methyltransferase/precorrin-2 dehydrogenase/sirohydrochlorin ferrochelatase